MATLVLSASKEGVKSYENRISTYARTQFLLRELGIDKKEYEKDAKLRRLCKMYLN